MSLRKQLVLLICFCTCLAGYAAIPNDSIPVDTLMLDDGTLYVGQIQDSLFNGHGRCIYADGTVYEGDWKDGLWDGQGVVIYPDGDVYKGEFRNHIKEGKGTYYYGSGAKYEGDWKNDRFNGNGKLQFEDGGRYEGAWKDDMKHGYGRLVSAEGFANTGYFYYDEYLGMPFDTEIVRDSVLTDELKSWGFEQEPPRGHSGLAMGVSYGTKGMLTTTLWNTSLDHFFYGLSIGFNIDPPTRGKSVSLGFNTFSDDIHFSGEYISSQYMIEGGYSYRNLSVGCSAGFGIVSTYINCRANGNYDYYSYYNIKYGQAYTRRDQTSHTFVYRGYLMYSFQAKEEKPKTHMCLGYGKADGLFIGVGLNL